MDIAANLTKRYKDQRNFELKIRISIVFIIFILVLMISSIFGNGIKAFFGEYLELNIPNNRSNLTAEYLIEHNFADKKQAELIRQIIGHKRIENSKIREITKSIKIKLTDNLPTIIQDNNEIKDLVKLLKKSGRLTTKFNIDILTHNDSRYPENAGLLGSITGSILTVLVALVISLPIGIITGIYLEEVAKNNWFKDFVEANINNLAAIPSIIYGLLGLSVFLAIFHLPRSSAILAGMTMSIMTLPLIIISTRQALQAIPASLRQGIRALGISESQLIIDHLLPLIIPGIMSGTIFTVSRVLGETAPLIMLGLVAFVANTASSIFEPTTTLTVQIYLWSVSIEKAYIIKTFAAIMILLLVISFLNLTAFIIRKKYEQRW